MKIKAFQFILGLVFLLTISPESLAGSPKQPGIDILHYDIHLTISDTSNSIDGNVFIHFSRQQDTNSLQLDFAPFAIDSILLDGQAITFSHQNDQLILNIPGNQHNLQHDLQIYYNGVPGDGLIIQKNKFGQRAFFVDNWPNRAHKWLPSVDHPSDKASVKMTIRAPQSYQIVANGPLQHSEIYDDGTKTHEFSMPRPIPVYCIVFGAARDFTVARNTVADSIDLTYWLFREDSLHGAQTFARAPQILAYFTKMFGSFPYEKLSLIQAVTRFGGMENAGAIFFNESSFEANNSIEVTVAHEIVHQWIGDWFTPQNWNELWLSEGFANYFGMQFFEKNEPVKFKHLMNQSRKNYLKRKEWHKRAIIESEPENLFELLNTNTYTKGGWVVHMLRQEMGDEAFFAALKTANARFAGLNWTVSDWQAICEKTTGKNLDWFFEQWLYKPGIPKLTIAWFQDSQNNLRIKIEQKQKTPVMQFPIDLHIFTTNQQTIHHLKCVKRNQQFTFQLDKDIVKIEADPEVRLLAELKMEKRLFK